MVICTAFRFVVVTYVRIGVLPLRPFLPRALYPRHDDEEGIVCNALPYPPRAPQICSTGGLDALYRLFTPCKWSPGTSLRFIL